MSAGALTSYMMLEVTFVEMFKGAVEFVAEKEGTTASKLFRGSRSELRDCWDLICKGKDVFTDVGVGKLMYDNFHRLIFHENLPYADELRHEFEKTYLLLRGLKDGRAGRDRKRELIVALEERAIVDEKLKGLADVYEWFSREIWRLVNTNKPRAAVAFANAVLGIVIKRRRDLMLTNDNHFWALVACIACTGTSISTQCGDAKSLNQFAQHGKAAILGSPNDGAVAVQNVISLQRLINMARKIKDPSLFNGDGRFDYIISHEIGIEKAFSGALHNSALVPCGIETAYFIEQHNAYALLACSGSDKTFQHLEKLIEAELILDDSRGLSVARAQQLLLTGPQLWLSDHPSAIYEVEAFEPFLGRALDIMSGNSRCNLASWAEFCDICVTYMRGAGDRIGWAFALDRLATVMSTLNGKEGGRKVRMRVRQPFEALVVLRPSNERTFEPIMPKTILDEVDWSGIDMFDDGTLLNGKLPPPRLTLEEEKAIADWREAKDMWMKDNSTEMPLLKTVTREMLFNFLTDEFHLIL